MGLVYPSPDLEESYWLGLVALASSSLAACASFLGVPAFLANVFDFSWFVLFLYNNF